MRLETTIILSCPSRYLVVAFLFVFIFDTAAQTQEPHQQTSSYKWNLPPGFPLPVVPANNPMSATKVELGRYLFYEPLLSANALYSCASCHQQRFAFTDNKAQALGVTGAFHPRSAMSLTNVAYNPVFSWASNKVNSLEQQVLIPLFNISPPEMGLNKPIEKLLIKLEEKNNYLEMFKLAFPGDEKWVTLDQIAKALAAFERTLISGNSPYDRYLFFDETEVLSDSAKQGMELFFSEKLACSQCHSGINFSSSSEYAGLPQFPSEFHNTNLYQRYPTIDTGLYLETQLENDKGKFRAPTLRNIELTAPYMHDGSIETLSEVIDHYARGGRATKEELAKKNGRKLLADNPRKSNFIRGFRVSESEKRALINFLTALTDHDFIVNKHFSDPHAR